MSSKEQEMSRMDRDAIYRIAALECAIARAGQDGGIHSEEVDVYGLAEKNYAWLRGDKDVDTQAPEAEITDATSS